MIKLLLILFVSTTAGAVTLIAKKPPLYYFESAGSFYTCLSIKSLALIRCLLEDKD